MSEREQIYGLSLRGQTVHSLRVSGIRNRPKSVLLRNLQHCYFSLIFYAVLDSTNKYLNHCTAHTRSKNMRICGIRNSICGIQNSLWNPQTNDTTFVSLN